MTAGALTGPSRTDVILRFTAAPGCDAVTAVKHVQIKTFAETGKVDGVVNFNDVAVQAGAADVALGRIERGRRIEADAAVQTGTPTRTYVLRDAKTALFPPHPARPAHGPLQTVTTPPGPLNADLNEVTRG